MIEVEQKYRLLDPDHLFQQLQDAGAHQDPPEQHVDAYYNHPCRDFSESREALRVRCIDGKPLVTYKGTKMPGGVKARRELEWPLGPGDSDGSKMQQLFQLLGFVHVATVCKTRQPFVLSDGDGKLSMTIDTVKELGSFAEVEVIATCEDEVEAARSRVLAVGERFGLHDREARSYLTMLLAHRAGADEQG